MIKWKDPIKKMELHSGNHAIENPLTLSNALEYYSIARNVHDSAATEIIKHHDKDFQQEFVTAMFRILSTLLRVS